MRAMRLAGFEQVLFSPDLDDLAASIMAHAAHQDVVMCMGAGSIGQVPLKLQLLSKNSTGDSSK
jgi:UDP-N-acetylmuramate--alanine ligase